MAENYGIVDKNGKIITATTDGTKERLDVSAKIEGGITASETRHRPKLFNNKTQQALDDTGVTLANINFDGKLDAIVVNFNMEKVELWIEIDGEEKIRVNFKDFQSSNYYSLYESTTSTEQFPIRFFNSGKQISIKYTTPVDITSNITIKAKNDGDSANKLAIAVLYREKVV